MFKRKSVLYVWILFCIVMLFMMILLAVMFWRGTRSQLEAEYKSISKTLQSQSVSAIESYFDDLETVAYSLCSDYQINDYVTSQEPYGSKYYDLYLIQQSLQIYDLESGEDTTQYLYMSNIDRVLSSGAIYPADEFYELIGMDEIMEKEEFQEFLKTRHYNDVLYVEDEGNNSKIIMASSIPLFSSSPKGICIQVIEGQAISRMIEANSAIEEGITAILDGEGNLISYAGNQETAMLLQSMNPEEILDNEILLDGERFWTSDVLTLLGDWSIVTVVPMSSITDKADNVLANVLPIMLVILFLSLCMCAYFIYLQYKPLRHLRELTANDHENQNEYQAIAKALYDARNGQEEIQKLWDEQTRQLCQEVVQSCLYGEIIYDTMHLQKVLDRVDITFIGDWYQVILFDTGGSASIEQGLWKEQLATIELSGAGTWLISSGQQWVVLVNASDEKMLNDAKDKITKSFSKVSVEMGIGLQSAVSKPCRDFRNIHLAYLEVTEELKYRNDKVCSTETPDSPQSFPDIPTVSFEQEQLLMQYIAAGNDKEAQNVLELIISHNWTKKQLDINILRCLTYDLMYGILNVIADRKEVWSDQVNAFILDLHTLRHANDREEMSALLMNSVGRSARACHNISKPVQAIQDQTMERIMTCVNEHYRETDFNVSRAAQYLNMSVSYLSSFFKQQTGIGLLNYISSMRVKYAKQCIQERHISVAQAAQEAGFENINTFIRTFKKFEGTTPGNLGK